MQRQFADKELKAMSFKKARLDLESMEDKRRWIAIHNATANLYSLSMNGIITEMPPQGWWY